MIMENNKVVLAGEIATEFEFSHEVFGEKFYLFYLKVDRKSKCSDIIPILISERLVDVKQSVVGEFVLINGQFRSYRKEDESSTKTTLSVFVKDIEVLEGEQKKYKNYILLNGYICKEPIYRTTPFGSEICDVVLAVNRPYRKSDYIWCLCWSRNARYIAMQQVGTEVVFEGRIQSREYKKHIADGEFETRVTYEVSVNKMEVVNSECED